MRKSIISAIAISLALSSAAFAANTGRSGYDPAGSGSGFSGGGIEESGSDKVANAPDDGGSVRPAAPPYRAEGSGSGYAGGGSDSSGTSGPSIDAGTLTPPVVTKAPAYHPEGSGPNIPF